MAFSFNWAGLTAPRVDPIRDEVDVNAMGAALGKGLRGYRNRQAADEYADKIDLYRREQEGLNSGDSNAVRELQEELARLKEENEYIDGMLSTAGQGGAQVERTLITGDPEAYDEEYARQFGIFENFDPEKYKTYTPEDIRAVQQFIGVPEADIDGKWGPQSQEYWDSFTRNYNMV